METRCAIQSFDFRTLQLAVDLLGYFSGGPDAANTQPVTGQGGLQSVAVARIYSHAVAANATVTVTVKGAGGAPVDASQIEAALVVIQVVSPSRSGAVLAYSGTRPGTRSLSMSTGATATNDLLVQTSSTGTISVFNSDTAASTITVDLYGFERANAVPSPAAISTGRYVQDITPTDISKMNAEGMADATAGDKLVLLEFGAQTEDMNGVQLTGPAGTLISYQQVENAVDSYLQGFGSHAGAVVAVGTNNDGPGPDGKGWTTFPPNVRGATWAKMVGAITAPAGVSVVGADDIEPDFFSTEAQAQQWETGYLNYQSSTTRKLIFNGSSDGCPQVFRSSANCNFGWTLKNIYSLAHNGSRISALPQIYFQSQANQWANIDAAGGNGITFAGVLNESAAENLQFTPPVAYQALYISLARLFTTPPIPSLVVNLQSDPASAG